MVYHRNTVYIYIYVYMKKMRTYEKVPKIYVDPMSAWAIFQGSWG